MAPGGDLASELQSLDATEVRSRGDAVAIVGALQRLFKEDPPPGGEKSLLALANLFTEVPDLDSPALDKLLSRGIPLLIKIVDRQLNGEPQFNERAVFYSLRVLANFGSAEGTLAVIRAAKAGYAQDEYTWHPLFADYTVEHPEHRRLFRLLANPLPTGFMAVAFADSANTAFLNGARGTHPFDSDAGIAQLEKWLTDEEQQHFTYAITATRALPFLKHARRDELLERATQHPSHDIRIEAARVAAQLDHPEGVEWLVKACSRINYSKRAHDFLDELGLGDRIPEETKEPTFQAQAQFAQWLAHPQELGRFPDELVVMDHRELVWPPEGKRLPLWLITYRIHAPDDQAGLNFATGMVGSVLFCLFLYRLEQRPPEDGYAIHCFWELESVHHLIESNSVAEGSTEYDTLLRQGEGLGAESLAVKHVAEISPRLGHPQCLVAVASGIREGKPGWVVLDGPRSRWYSSEEMPKGEWVATPLKIHLGRELLGLREPDDLDRRRYLRPEDDYDFFSHGDDATAEPEEEGPSPDDNQVEP